MAQSGGHITVTYHRIMKWSKKKLEPTPANQVTRSAIVHKSMPQVVSKSDLPIFFVIPNFYIFR